MPNNVVLFVGLVGLFSLSLVAQPTNTATPEKNLVELVYLDSSLMLDLRYATVHNFTGKAVYPSARCFLRREAAEALVRVQRALIKRGYRLKIFDGYRPLSVQRRFWEIFPDERYVANPEKGSRHNRGMAVDVTLVTLTGKDLEMPTEYDDFSEKAHRDYADLSAEVLANRDLLTDLMEQEGFQGLKTEWWHFDYQGWEDCPLLDLSFDQIAPPIFPLRAEPILWDFGKVPDTQTVRLDVTLHNESTSAVKILDIFTSCACALADPQPAEIPAQGQCTLTIHFNPRGRRGPIPMEAKVVTDCPTQPSLYIPLTAMVLRDGLLSEDLVSFGEFRRGETIERAVWIAPAAVREFRVLSAEFQRMVAQSAPSFAVRVEPGTYPDFYPAPRAGYRILLKADPAIPCGLCHGFLEITTDIPGQEKLRLPVLARVIGEIGLTRDYLALGLIKDNMLRPKGLRLFQREGKRFIIHHVESSLPFLTIAIRPVIPEQDYEIVVRPQWSDDLPVGEFRGLLRIFTSSPDQPEIDVPLQGIIVR